LFPFRSRGKETFMSTDVANDEVREAHACVLKAQAGYERRPLEPSPDAEREYRRALMRFHAAVARELGLPLPADEATEEAAE
jgi:hypothetical protein